MEEAVIVGAHAHRDFDSLLSVLASKSAERLPDGWREPILDDAGYRCVYDKRFATGEWEFRQLQDGLWLITVDMVAQQPLFRRHSFGRKLVLTAVLNGGVEISGSQGLDGELSNGCCTVYGMDHGEGFETVYERGQSLRWVSIIIDRDLLFEATGLGPQDVPDAINQFVSGTARVPYRNIMLSPNAYYVATQLLECGMQAGYRRAYLSAKALEFVYLMLQEFGAAHSCDADRMTLSPKERAKVKRAMRYLKASLDEPPNIAELAYAVDMTRQKLQFGFRHLYGDTVGSVRDKLRAEHALELVKNSSKSMIEIALEIGYGHPPSFTRAFKAAFGVSPIQMRRMAQFAPKGTDRS